MAEELEKVISSFCREGSRFVGSEYFRVRRLEFELLRMLSPDFFSRKYERVLELGCGIGFKALLMSSIAKELDAVDIEEPYHGFACEESAAVVGRRIFCSLGVENVHLFAEQFEPFMAARPDTYDLIYSEYVLEHISDLPRLFRAMSKCLRPGGQMIHIVPNSNYPLVQFCKENLQSLPKGLLKVIKGLFRNFTKGEARRPKMNARGIFIPVTHSEFIGNYSDQFEICCLENYVFKMIEAGFSITKISPIREYSNAVFAKK